MMLSMVPGDNVVTVLGGAKAFAGRGASTPSEMRDRVREGLPLDSLESVRDRLGLTIAEVSRILGIPPRTLARRRRTGKLAADESDRLYRVARVADHATAVFGDEAKAAAWLRRPNRSLGGEKPVEMLDTDVGARQVEDALGRLEYGVVG